MRVFITVVDVWIRFSGKAHRSPFWTSSSVVMSFSLAKHKISSPYHRPLHAFGLLAITSRHALRPSRLVWYCAPSIDAEVFGELDDVSSIIVHVYYSPTILVADAISSRPSSSTYTASSDSFGIHNKLCTFDGLNFFGDFSVLLKWIGWLLIVNALSLILTAWSRKRFSFRLMWMFVIWMLESTNSFDAGKLNANFLLSTLFPLTWMKNNETSSICIMIYLNLMI